MPFLTLRDLSYVTPDGRTLFSSLDLSFAAEKTALIGRNGVGKTTLVRLMAGDITPTSGSVRHEGVLRLLHQDVGTDGDATVADAFGVGKEMAILLDALEGRGDALIMGDIDWTLDERVAEALAGVGLDDMPLTARLSALSGGQRSRVALAALFFDAPDLVILDEPTNNLDRDGRALVTDLLDRHAGGAIVISHDRELLRRMDRIVELSDLGARLYGGNWDFYDARRAEERTLSEARLESAAREVKAVERRNQEARERQAKRDAAGAKARRRGDQPKMLMDARRERAEATAGGGGRLADRKRAGALEALSAAKEEVERVRPMKAGLAGTGLAAASNVLAFEAVTGGFRPSNPAIRSLSFAIVGPERVAVTGPNGAGKTTLLKLAMGEMAPVSGRVARSVPTVFLDQDVALLDRRMTILDNYRRLNPADDDRQCRSALARFLFRADAALREVGTLSGGEILRSGLACVLGGASPPQLLVLDEPTNHLDIASIEAVEAGLNGYDGALLVVSHDQAFLEAIGITRTIALPQAEER